YSATELPPLRLPQTGIPNHRTWASKYPEKDARLQRVKVAVLDVAASINMPTENLISPDTLRTLCWELESEGEEQVKDRILQLGGREWQAILTSKVIVEALVDPQTTGQN
ncbi:MAG: ribonuclease D, partial [Microbacteriaceae bacterium]